MASTNPPPVDFIGTLQQLPTNELWNYGLLSTESCADIAQAAFEALQSPLDFPALQQAIVPGDRVALAVDANIPSLEQVLAGVLRAVESCGAAEIDLVLSDEATDETVASITAMVGAQVHVTRHQTSLRECLRYVAADEQADPIYLNRWLVDADFVLPVVAARTDPILGSSNHSSVYPRFADARTRRRVLDRLSNSNQASRTAKDATGRSASSTTYDEPAWWLGVQLILSVTANQLGQAARIVAGTSLGLNSDQTSLPDDAADGIGGTAHPTAAIVIASLDGSSQQQSWVNAARAVVAATGYTRPGGTIVLWSEIDDLPRLSASNLLDEEASEEESVTDTSRAASAEAGESNDAFPSWYADDRAIEALHKIADEFRVMIHSRLDAEAIESLGFGAVTTAAQLQNLCRSFASCGLLRAAQFTPGGSG
jgi:hypothetical protein